MAKFYCVNFFIGGGVFTIAYCRKFSGYPTPWLKEYLFLLFAANGLFNTVCYAYNARLLGSNVCSCLKASSLCWWSAPRYSVDTFGSSNILSLRLSVLADCLGDRDMDADHVSIASFFGVHACKSNVSAETAALHRTESTLSTTGFHDLDLSQGNIGQIRERIDKMWVHELQINCFAEVWNVLVETAAEVEGRTATVDAVDRAYARAEGVRDWVAESLMIRLEVCSFVALDGGRAGVERTILDQHAAAMRCVRPHFDRLLHGEHAAEIKTTAQEMLQKLSNELESISFLKEENTNIFFEEIQHLVELQEVELAYTDNVLRAARANPESATLLRTGIQAVLKLLKVIRAASVQDAPIVSTSGYLDYTDFVMQAMRDHLADRKVQEDACLVLSMLIALGPQLAERISSLGGIDLVNAAMVCHAGDATVQTNGCLAIAAQKAHDL